MYALARLTANWLKPAIVARGLDPGNLPAPHGLHRPNLLAGVMAWRNVWSGGRNVIEGLDSRCTVMLYDADGRRGRDPSSLSDYLAGHPAGRPV